MSDSVSERGTIADHLVINYSGDQLIEMDNGGDDPIIRWSQFHSDPLHDLVIQSNDWVYFRASSHVLKRESSLFYDMLTSNPQPTISEGNHIPLDFPSTSISIFLDCCATATAIDYSAFAFRPLYEHHKLVRYLDCPRLLSHVEEVYKEACRREPLEYLFASSDDSHVVGAKRALQRCRHAEVEINSANVFEVVDRVRREWRHALLTCLLGVKPGKLGVLSIRWPDKEAVKQFGRDVRGSGE